MVRLHIKLKGMKYYGNIYYIYSQFFVFARIPANPELGQKVKTFFSEKGHAAYQIKGNDTYNNMQAMIVFLNAPSTPGFGPKV